MLLAFLFSVALRFIWVYQFHGYAPFYHNGQFMINTNDGYYWAEGARDLLRGENLNPQAENFWDRFHQANDLSPTGTAPAQLTALLAKVLPFSFETIIFYMPAFLGSLIVIPILLIGKELKNLELGFIAALIASVTWSYYNRTMAGYYDTDMLNIVLPLFLLWSIMGAVRSNRSIYLFLVAIDILIYRWWYPQSYSLEFAFFGMILLYALLFDRKNPYNYRLLTIMLLAMMNGPGVVRLALVLLLLFLYTKPRFDRYLFHFLAAALLAFLATGGLSPIWYQLENYVFRDRLKAEEEGLGLHFFTVMQTIREAGHIPFETFANRISGHTVTFVLSLFGYLYLLYRHRLMLFSLPMLGLGFLAYSGGLRFTIYAVPILAFGIAYLIVELSRLLPTRRLRLLSLLALTLLVLFPNYRHIERYKVPTVFNADEVAVLEKLGKIAKPQDYVVAWWDYGYPIRYYADVKTLVDGGKHSGAVNFSVSYILTHPQDEAARLARLEVEQTEKTFDFIQKHKEEIEDKNLTVFSTIEQMTTEHGFRNTNDFLDALKSGAIQLPKKNRDIYLYLPYRMLNIYPTVALFSNLDLMTGRQGKEPVFFTSRNFRKVGEQVLLSNNLVFDLKNLTLQIGKKTVPVRRFVITEYNKEGKLHTKVIPGKSEANFTILYLASHQTFLLVDERTFQSTYIQLGLLEKYDPKLFKPVILTPNAKVYQLRI